MKPISSVITGMANPEQKAENSTGSERGGTGYAERPRRFYGLDHEPIEEPRLLPVKPERPNTLQKSASMTPSPLPELRQVWLGVDHRGDRTTIPVLARRSDIPALKSSISQMREALEPAGPEEIAATMARLFSHYPSPQSGNTMTVAQDWLEDMGQVSAIAFRQAVTEWRRGPNAFRPSPGQLLAIVNRIEAPFRERLEHAEDILAREESLTPKDLLSQLHQRQYEVEELGMAPYEVHQMDAEEQQDWREVESAYIRAEIKKLEAQGG